MLKKFIQRPVLSLVISLFITLLGVLALSKLPVTQYPDIAPPAVSVTTKYTGANAEVCAKAVVTPLERAINGVPGMAYMTSVSGNDGTSIIQVYFKVGTDPDLAAVNVQNRVSTVLDELPEEVIKAGVSTEKEVNSMLMYLNLISNDSTLDEKFIYNFADINVLAELKRIDGVGFADIMGQREYAMRVWLKPQSMDAYEISAEEIIQSLKAQNIEAAPGKVGESSGRNSQSLQYVLRYTGKLTHKEQYENIVIKISEDGEMLRLKDVADIEFGSLDYDVLSKENGKPSAAIILKQRPGSNASEVISNIKERLEFLKSTSFPPGMDYTISYDVSRFLDASIHEVIKTLIEAFLLVALVVFLFLQDWRSTLIPVLAVPVSLVGTFAFMQLFGFSINLLTLFALVLAIGIVVDNAIVVVEAVHAKMEENNTDPKTATMQAMGEIGGAIVAITLVMSAVFIPVAFLDGPVGVFYRQFSVTMAISIVISGINALTLTPALCAIMLKNHNHHPKSKNWLTRFFDGFNRYYDSIALKYRKLLDVIVNRRVVTIGVLAIFSIATWGVGKVLPTGFIPTEDQGTIYVNVTTPVGATLERTEKVMNQIDDIAKTITEIESSSTLAGFSMMTDGSGASFGMSTISLKPWKDREKTADDIIALLKEKTSHIKDAEIQFFPPPAVPGFGNASGFELRLLDKTGSGNLQETYKVTQDFMKAVKERKEIKSIFTSFNPTFPQYLIHVDQDVAAKKGITVDNAMSNLQTLMGSFYATNFIRFGQMYKVMLQSDPKFRAQPEDILKLRVKNKDGEMVPYSLFCKIERVYGPEQLTRYNMYVSAMLNGEAADGYSSGDAIKAIEEVAKEKLPRGYSHEWSGMTREEILSGNQVVFVFAICLLFVYLLLSAQYESFLLPLPVLLSLPIGIFGSLFFLYILGLENNIYAQVAMVMLIGLLGKNAILIIEFAILKQKEGKTVMESAIEGAMARLRPILMTSFAFIAGLIPLMIASGAGAIGNKTIGSAAAGGMLFGTLFGVIIIPGLYVLFASIIEKKKKKKHIEIFTDNEKK
jgi:HAE1 family hydrophobic/amphiphilic exporter-1